MLVISKEELINKKIKVKLRNGNIVEGFASGLELDYPIVCIKVPTFDIDYKFEVTWNLLYRAVYNEIEIRV